MPVINITCPLGSQCEEIKNNEMNRCAWYTKLVGKDPQTQKDIEEWRCAVSWLPLMNVEVAQTNRAQTDAIVSMRDETCQRQDVFNAIAMKNIQLREREKLT